MKHLYFILLTSFLFFLSQQNVLAQNNLNSSVISGKASFTKQGFTFDPYQHPGLILLEDTTMSYGFKSKAIQTNTPAINVSSLQEIASIFAKYDAELMSKSTLMKDDTVQFTFLVINDTDESRWVLDLMPSIFLPRTDYKKIELFNPIAKKRIATFKPNQTKHVIRLKKNTPYVLTVSFDTATTHSGTYAPILYSYGSAYDTQLLSLEKSLFLALTIGIFTASILFLFLFPIVPATQAFIGWGLFSAGVILNVTTVSDSLTALIPALFVVWLPFMILAYRGYLYRVEAPSLVFVTNFLALACSGAMAIAALLPVLNIINVDSTILNLLILALFISSGLCACVSSIFLIISRASLPNIAMLFGFSALTLGATITGLSVIDLDALDIIPLSTFSISLFSLSVVFYGLCWIFSVSTEVKTSHGERAHSTQDKEEITNVGSLSYKLFETREAFDNTRLVQVLKRERTIMQELRDKDVELTKQMQEEKEKADYANQAKSAFLAVISHEIRTPMTGIMGMVRLLRHSGLSSEQDDHVNTISDSGDAMMALLNDILDFEKIDTGKMDLESIEFDLYNMARNVQSLMVGRTNEKNIALRLEVEEGTPQYIHGDPTRLRQILLNLVSNAIKFTETGHVSIQIKKMDQQDGKLQLYFAVQDTGLGIPKEAQENLFNPFSQADSSTSRKYGGSGLGLAICQKLVTAMGGDININSSPGEGSTFFFSIIVPEGKENDSGAVIPPVLSDVANSSKSAKKQEKITPSNPPITPPPSIKPKEPTPTPSSSEKMIMIVDDNAINQKVMAGFISPMGHKTEGFTSGEKAIDALKETPEKFDIVFMDIEMPGISGVETTRIIREELKISKSTLPIVALTGNTGEDDIASYMNVGMTGYLAKPINADALEKLLQDSAGSKKEEASASSITPLKQHIKQNESTIDAQPKPPVKTEEAIITPSSTAISQPAPPPQENKQENLTVELPTETESGLELDDDFEVVTETEQQKGKAPEQSPHEVSLSDMNTGLSIDETADEAGEADKEAQSYNPADFDATTLMSLKTSMQQEELSEMVQDLISKLESLSRQVSTSTKEQKFDIVRARAHDLKGMAGNFGLVGVSTRATLIEDSIKEGPQPAVTLINLADSLAKDIEQAKAFLSKWT